MRSMIGLLFIPLFGAVSCGLFLGIDDLEFVDDGAAGGGPCAADCATEGATRCDGTRVQTCSRSGECLSWSESAACSDGGICCSDRCAAIDEANCYACGATCGGTTPRCLSGPQKCGCSVASCGAQQLGCDPRTGDCVTCTGPEPSATELFVDATSFGGTGTEACPFKTIGAALGALPSFPQATTLRVAEGVYDAALGESFPIVLRNGVSLLGAGSAKTVLHGQGRYDHTVEGGQFPSASLSPTILLGHESRTTRLEGVTLRPIADPATVDEDQIGIFCDRGNVTAPGYPATRPEPNTLVHDVVIESGYSIGAVVTDSAQTGYPSPSACNIKVTGAQFLGGKHVGLWTLGCGRDNSNERGNYWVSATIGEDGPAGAVRFAGYDRPDGRGASGITMWDCTRSLIVTNATFEDSNIGISAVQHEPSPGDPYEEVIVEKSTFQRLNNAGIGLYLALTIERLTDNSFLGNRAPDDAQGNASAIFMQEATVQIKNARRNRFLGNDVALQSFYGSASRSSDFGTASDPGENLFRCNAAKAGTMRLGGDVLFLLDTAQSTGLQHSFVGNRWDHAPVTVATSLTANGQDLVSTAGAELTFDVSQATVGPVPCPDGASPGP
jgi:hypothetical protein